MVRIRLERDLNELRNDIITVGSWTDDVLQMASTIFQDGDSVPYKEVDEAVRRIVSAKRKLEENCLRLLASEQPLASDFRLVSAIFKMASHIKRIGELAGALVELADESEMRSDPAWDILEDMLAEGRDMLHSALRSLVRFDTDLAQSTIDRDAIVDQLFRKLREEIIQELREGDSPDPLLPDALLMGKFLEKIGDHAASSAEWVLFAIGDRRE